MYKCYSDQNISFNEWNFKKKKIDQKTESTVFPKEKEVWYMSIGKNIGREQNGSGRDFERPVLIIKKWNNEMVWGVPLSTKQKKQDFYYNFTDIFGREVSIIAAQLKLLSTHRCVRNTIHDR